MRAFVPTALLLAAAASLAPAAQLVYEPFDYPAGALLGQTNASTGTNWLLAATGVTSTTAINVVANSLANDPPLPDNVGGALAITGQGNLTGGANRLAFAATGGAVTSGSVYYSLHLRVDDLTGSNNLNGGFFVGLNNTTAAGGSPTAAAARLQMRIDPTDATKYNLGIFPNVNATAAATSWSGPLTVGEQIFVVAAIDIVAGTVNDVARMWINPGDLGAATAPAPTITAAVGGSDINIASVIVRQSPTPQLTLDELRVGTEWSDVTPVPEPAAASLLGLASTALLTRRRRA